MRDKNGGYCKRFEDWFFGEVLGDNKSVIDGIIIKICIGQIQNPDVFMLAAVYFRAEEIYKNHNLVGWPAKQKLLLDLLAEIVPDPAAYLENLRKTRSTK